MPFITPFTSLRLNLVVGQHKCKKKNRQTGEICTFIGAFLWIFRGSLENLQKNSQFLSNTKLNLRFFTNKSVKSVLVDQKFKAKVY